jgi:hypothetical protein
VIVKGVPAVKVSGAIDPDVPVFESYVSKYWFAVQIAYKVIDAVAAYGEVRTVVPVVVVAQPVRR